MEQPGVKTSSSSLTGSSLASCRVWELHVLILLSLSNLSFQNALLIRKCLSATLLFEKTSCVASLDSRM